MVSYPFCKDAFHYLSLGCQSDFVLSLKAHSYIWITDLAAKEMKLADYPLTRRIYYLNQMNEMIWLVAMFSLGFGQRIYIGSVRNSCKKLLVVTDSVDHPKWG